MSSWWLSYILSYSKSLKETTHLPTFNFIYETVTQCSIQSMVWTIIAVSFGFDSQFKLPYFNDLIYWSWNTGLLKHAMSSKSCLGVIKKCYFILPERSHCPRPSMSLDRWVSFTCYLMSKDIATSWSWNGSLISSYFLCQA